MDTRREFIRKAAMLAGATGLTSVFPPSIQRAMAIDPAAGTTWLDAQHVVILMQENRSFDHCFGALQGVRGFRDPRAITLPDNNPVWLQTNEAGETYTPFRLDIKDTKATWMGSLPHSWTNQVDARHDGKYDQWLHAKHSGNKEYAQMPLTLGYYDRRDIPFYYAMADAFTICDQNFCSSLTGTTPNRLYLWTGTIRDEQHGNVRARVRNEDTDYGVPATWITFPELLEDLGVDWRIYQNEISLYMGFKGEEDAWLSNFTDNPIEWFSQYNVRFHPAYVKSLPDAIVGMTRSIDALQQKLASLPADSDEVSKVNRELAEQKKILAVLQDDQLVKTPENFEKLSQRAKNLHRKAFTTNIKDPSYHELTALNYQDGDTAREVKVPKGDVLYQFREDVKSGKLPPVSWLVAPENFSDHPGAPWYGAWYVSEVIDILTKDPEVWKKTIFILCYDENDGYFDHVPPFVAPDPTRPETGLVSKGIDAAVEYVTREQDLQGTTPDEARGGPIGLGYRVPLLIASPWSRGGYVNSQVFDHTSISQLLEKFIRHKTGKPIEDTNISAWRRTVCGDLSSVFRPYNGEGIKLPSFLAKNDVYEGIHKAKFKQLPTGYKQLSKEEIGEFRSKPRSSPLMSQQEKGLRPSCALPYELYVDGDLNEARDQFSISMRADKTVFKERAAGSPFIIYAYGKEVITRNYAVVAGDQLTDAFALDSFENGHYDLRVYGPNGFYRAFRGDKNDPPFIVEFEYEFNDAQTTTGRILCRISNTDSSRPFTVLIRDNAYKTSDRKKILTPVSPEQGRAAFILDPAENHGWYDYSILVEGDNIFEKRYTGRVETGKDGRTDPSMGIDL